jgi:magnesium chelatase family protein
VEVGALAAEELINTPPGESTASIRLRVTAARARALARQGGTNQALDGQAIDAQCRLDDASAKFLNTAAARLGWSGRSIHRCLKVARTIADLAGARAVQVTHVAEAVQYRRALKAH